MAKVRKLSDNQQEIAFTEFDFYQQYIETFKTSELGKLKILFPLREMAISFGLIVLLELSRKLKIQEQQKLLVDAWKPYMKNLDTVYTDASCYKSLMRFPTDVKLLWECVERYVDFIYRRNIYIYVIDNKVLLPTSAKTCVTRTFRSYVTERLFCVKIQFFFVNG